MVLNLYAPTCSYTCITINKMVDSVLGISSHNWTIAELLDRLRCNLEASNGRKHNFPEVFH